MLKTKLSLTILLLLTVFKITCRPHYIRVMLIAVAIFQSEFLTALPSGTILRSQDWLVFLLTCFNHYSLLDNAKKNKDKVEECFLQST